MMVNRERIKIFGKYDLITVISATILILSAFSFIAKYFAHHVGDCSDIAKLEREYKIVRKRVDALVASDEGEIGPAAEVRSEYEAWIAKTAVQPNWAIVGSASLIIGLLIGISSPILGLNIWLMSVIVFVLVFLFGRFITSYLNFHSTGGFRFRSKSCH